MKCFVLIASLLVASASAIPDGIGGHRGNHGDRGGRQLATGYTAGAASAPVLSSYGAGNGPLPSYEDGSSNDLEFQASEIEEESTDPLAMLMKAVPGTPGEDYPIYAEAPETGFVCDGQVNGGYYADPEAECQVFHICTADGTGGLTKYSFLCPNGTIFNQEYFICDWWFNFDCSQAEAIAAEKNAELQAAREEADLRSLDNAAEGLDAAGSAPLGSYGVGAAPSENNFNSLPSYGNKK